jgi:hypothetical protein
MGYNRVNFLRRVIDIQNIYLRERERGATGEWVYRRMVAPVYHISKSTFQKYMSINAKKELHDIESKQCSADTYHSNIQTFKHSNIQTIKHESNT